MEETPHASKGCAPTGFRPSTVDGSDESTLRVRQVAIRPPEYFPRCSVAALIDQVDEFIIADTFAYSRQSFQNRSSIRTPDGRMWLTLPVGSGQIGRPISEVELVPGRDWGGKHLRSLIFNYSSTPFYAHFEPELQAFLDTAWTTLADVTTASMHMIARWLGIRTRIRLLSELGGAADLAACGSVIGERRVIVHSDAVRHDSTKIDVNQVLNFSSLPYVQNFDGFEADLSVLDLIFNWGPEALPMLRSRAELGLT